MIKNGDIVTFQIKARNIGYSNALNCILSVDIPLGVGYKASVCSKGSYEPLDNKWSIGGLEPSEEVTMQLSLEILNDSLLPAFVEWEITTDSGEITNTNNNGQYLISESCYALRHCLEFLKYKHVWIDFQNGNNEAQLENILKPFSNIPDAIAAVNALETLPEKKGWHYHISGEVSEDLTIENISGENIIEFENFKTDNNVYFNNIGSKLMLKGEITKNGENEVLSFSETVNLETIILDLCIFRNMDGYTANQSVEPLGNIWIKSCLVESNMPFGVPVNGNPIIFKPI